MIETIAKALVTIVLVAAVSALGYLKVLSGDACVLLLTGIAVGWGLGATTTGQVLLKRATKDEP